MAFAPAICEKEKEKEKELPRADGTAATCRRAIFHCFTRVSTDPSWCSNSRPFPIAFALPRNDQWTNTCARLFMHARRAWRVNAAPHCCLIGCSFLVVTRFTTPERFYFAVSSHRCNAALEDNNADVIYLPRSTRRRRPHDNLFYLLPASAVVPRRKTPRDLPP